MADRFVLPRWQALDNAGNPLPGAKLYTYQTGSYTPKPTYTDAALTVPHANPIVANAAGRFPDIFPDTGLYRLRLETAQNQLVWEADEVEGSGFGFNQYLLRNGALPMTGPLLIAPGDNNGVRVDGNTGVWIRRPTAQPNVLQLGTGGAVRLTVRNTNVEAHVPLIVPAATADTHAPRWEQVRWYETGPTSVSGAGPFEILSINAPQNEFEFMFVTATNGMSANNINVVLQMQINSTWHTTNYSSDFWYLVGASSQGTGGRTNGAILSFNQHNVKAIWRGRRIGAQSWFIDASSASASTTAYPHADAGAHTYGNTRLVVAGALTGLRMVVEAGSVNSGQIMARWR